MNCTMVSSSWSAGNGHFYVEAVVITEAGKSTVYQSPALTADYMKLSDTASAEPFNPKID